GEHQSYGLVGGVYRAEAGPIPASSEHRNRVDYRSGEGNRRYLHARSSCRFEELPAGRFHAVRAAPHRDRRPAGYWRHSRGIRAESARLAYLAAQSMIADSISSRVSAMGELVTDAKVSHPEPI